MTKRTEAQVAYKTHKDEVLRMLDLIKAAVEADQPETVHWGHVGDISEVRSNLKNAAHWAGVKEFTEE